jgi:ABC-type phosphate/phosphonate transport system substrate-binding protein
LWSDRWTTFISNIPQTFRQDLLKKIESENLQHKDNSAIISVLVATADVDLAGDVFSRLYSFRNETPDASEKTTKTQWDIIRQLKNYFERCLGCSYIWYVGSVVFRI